MHRPLAAVALFLTCILPACGERESGQGAGVEATSGHEPAARQTGKLYEARSDFNGTVIVHQDEEGIRRLYFGEAGATQSALDTADPNRLVLPYARAAMTALAAVPEPRRILIIGLGGGSMPTFLRRAVPLSHIDVVDIDPLVVDVARRFFGFKEDRQMKAHVGDGRKFIEAAGETYDIIFLDAYGEDSVPYALATKEFLAAVRARLAPRGVAASNVWGSGANPMYKSMLKTHQAVFDEMHVVKAEGSANRIILAFAHRPGLSEEGLAKAAEKAPAATKGLELGSIIRNGYEPVGELPASAKVLLDADAPRD
jgi:spermidine synthase